MYRPIVAIDVTAKNATGTPELFPNRAGIVMISAKPATNSTDQVGVRCAFRRRHSWWPGTAPSREKANTIRDEAATQPIPQNSCAIVEMSSTAFDIQV